MTIFISLCVCSCAVGAAIFLIQAVWQACWADLERCERRNGRGWHKRRQHRKS